MSNILSNIKTFCMAAMFAVTALHGSALSAKGADAAADPERTYYIVYHDDYKNIIRRDPYTEGYTFHTNDPFFWVTLPVSNTAWCTVFVEEEGVIPTGANVYSDGGQLANALTEDLHVYPVTSYGTFVYFNSDGGTPVPYQFVHVGVHAVSPTAPTKTGYTFAGWYDENGQPFNFASWSPVKTEGMAKEITLTAHWTAAISEYKVHIWLEKAEHPDREDADDALAHFLDDYVYGGSITKSGYTDSDVAFGPDTESSDNKAIISNIIDFKPTGTLTIHQYFYDDFDGSLAKSMSEASVDAVNAGGGIKADGSTNVNVFYRRLRYTAHVGMDNPSLSYTFFIRFEETIGAAIERHGTNIDSRLGQHMDKNTFEYDDLGGESRMGPSGQYWEYGDEYPNGMNGYWFESPKIYYNDLTVKKTIPDQIDVYTTLKTTNAGNSIFRRQIYFQNLDVQDRTSLDLGNYTLKETQNWVNNNETIDGFWPYQYEGFSLSKRQIVKADDRTTYYNKNGINGQPSDYDPNNNGYPHYSFNGSTSGADNGWQLELFYVRNSHTVTFETFTNQISVTHSEKFDNVYYEQLLSTISSDIKHGGEAFVVDQTTYQGSQNAIYAFKGWYDNAGCEGTPVDFSTFEMPDHNVVFYAKWEKKPITLTFNPEASTINGQSSLVVDMYSGQIPEDHGDAVSSVFPRLQFFSWTRDGKFYEFREPLYEDTELVALYYAPPVNPLKITYKAGAGTGSDVLEFADYGYLYNANAGVQEFFSDWTLPKGKIFKYWDDGEGNHYNPDGEIIMKNDVTLTAVYEGGHADIVIKREGLHTGESATFAVYKGSGESKTWIMNVSVTGTSSDGSATVSRKIVNMEPDTYTVEETDWSWAYNKGTTTVKEDGGSATPSSTNGIGTGEVGYNETLEFTFTGAALVEVSKHGEHVIPNEFSRPISVSVDVEPYKKNPDIHIKF